MDHVRSREHILVKLASSVKVLAALASGSDVTCESHRAISALDLLLRSERTHKLRIPDLVR